MSTALSPLRAGKITGSRIPAILGLSPYNNRAGVMREMVRQHHGADEEFTGNIATDWGTEHEDEAITAYEQREAVFVHAGQGILVHPNGILAVTPDGLIGDDGLIEVKCPWRGTYTHISERPDYEAQCRLALEVTGRDWCDFVVWRPGSIAVSRVVRDPEWLPLVLPDLELFLAEYQTIITDPALSAPYLQPLVDERTDGEWALAAVAYLEAKTELDRAAANADFARQELIALAGESTARGAGVHVIRSERKGSVSYAKALKALAPTADLSPFQSAPSVVFQVRTSAEGEK